MLRKTSYHYFTASLATGISKVSHCGIDNEALKKKVARDSIYKKLHLDS